MGANETSADRNWPKDQFGRHEVWAQWNWLAIAAIVFGAFLAIPLINIGKATRRAHLVIAYVAQDQVYAEPIFRGFEKQTGIKVRAVYDNEAVKTVGLANRLLAERNHPQCDVFWGNEEMRTRELAVAGAFRETNGWSSFGYRTRRLV